MNVSYNRFRSQRSDWPLSFNTAKVDGITILLFGWNIKCGNLLPSLTFFRLWAAESNHSDDKRKQQFIIWNTSYFSGYSTIQGLFTGFDLENNMTLFLLRPYKVKE